MRFSNLVLAAAAGSIVDAADQSVCDRYTTALLKENTAKNQATLLTLLVNTVVIGNYTMPNKNAVPGILAPGEIDGKKVNLAPYFSGALASTNTGGKMGEAVNFLDGGGAEPLKKNMPANDTKSHQYFLLTHLYQFFGTLLGCSMQGMAGFDAYGGRSSMYEVHKFMGLGKPEMDYFITQVGLAAASFGVTKDDITTVANALNTTFNVACSPAVEIVKSAGPQLQAICIDQASCMKAKAPVCDKYASVVQPQNATGTMAPSGSQTMMPSGTMTGTMSMTSGATGTQSGATTSPTKTGAAVANGVNFAAAAAGLAAFLL